MAKGARRAGRVAALLIASVAGLGSGLAAGPFTGVAAAASYAATPLSSFDANLVAHINKARAAHGLGRVIVTAGTTDVAHRWTCRLATQQVLAHNGGLSHDLETHGSRYWTMYAENVAVQKSGQSAGAMFKAYMNSPEHRANILDPSVRFIGIWSKKSGTNRFNTIDFVGSRASSYSNAYGAPHESC